MGRRCNVGNQCLCPMLHICINHYTIITVEPDKTEAVVDKEKDLTPISKELNEKEKKDSASVSGGTNECEEKDKNEHKKDKKIKMVTRDKALLLACSYFDLNHSGYIESKDAEDILVSLTLNLSRAQVGCMVIHIFG